MSQEKYPLRFARITRADCTERRLQKCTLRIIKARETPKFYIVDFLGSEKKYRKTEMTATGCVSENEFGTTPLNCVCFTYLYKINSDQFVKIKKMQIEKFGQSFWDEANPGY